MITAYSILGALTALALCIAGASMGVTVVLDKIADMRAKRDHEIARGTLIDFGVRLENHDAFWFTEDADAFALLKLVGNSIADTGHFDASEVRTKWRNRRKESTVA